MIPIKKKNKGGERGPYLCIRLLDEPPISNKNADTEVDEEEYWIPDRDLEEEQLQEKKEKTGKVS